MERVSTSLREPSCGLLVQPQANVLLAGTVWGTYCFVDPEVAATDFVKEDWIRGT